MSDYQTITRSDSRVRSDFLVRNGQLLLPMVKLVEDARAAIDEVIDVTGRAVIEASAVERAGSRTPGKRSGNIRHHGVSTRRYKDGSGHPGHLPRRHRAV